MIPVATLALLASRAKSGFAFSSLRPVGGGSLSRFCLCLWTPCCVCGRSVRRRSPAARPPRLFGCLRPPLLEITLPGWGDSSRPPSPGSSAGLGGEHGEVKDTDAPSDCDSDGVVTRADSSDTPRYGRCGRDVLPPRPRLAPEGMAADPSAPLEIEAWRAGGDLIDVIRATGLRDGWTGDEIRLAQAKVRTAAGRKRPPKWLHSLERATEWVAAAPYPSPVADARMPTWAKGLLLARVSCAPAAAGLVRGPIQRPPGEPPLGGPSRAGSGPAGLKRKRELGVSESDASAASAETARVGCRGSGCALAGRVYGVAPVDGIRVKSESPTPSLISGEDSVATGFSGEEGDDDGTCLCPGWAVKRRPSHLVVTSAYEGDDLTGAFWAAASPGEGVAMRVVDQPADTAVDSFVGGEGGTPPTPAAASSASQPSAWRVTDAVGPRLVARVDDVDEADLPPGPRYAHPWPLPEAPMGPRETAT